MAWDDVEYHAVTVGSAAQVFLDRGADEQDAGEVAAEVSKDEQAFDESVLPITTGHYLYLSGTPFRALASGEFIEEQIYNWTYSDEQRAKRDWKGSEPNPYASLPRLVLMTYKLPDDIRQVAEEGEFNEFAKLRSFIAKVKTLRLEISKDSNKSMLHRPKRLRHLKHLAFVRTNFY